MKTFDVFVKERLGEITLKPMKTFDVFVKDRLTQIDITISTLVSREVFSFYDKMVIDCTLQELEFLKEISVQSGMDISVRLNRLYATVSALAKAAMTINSKVNFSQEDFISSAVELEISSLPFYIVNDLQTDFQSSQIITFSLDMFDTGKSLGSGLSKLILSTSQVEMDKISYLSPENKMMLLNKADFSGKKVASLNPVNLEFDVSRFNLFYLTLIEGKTSMYLGTALVDKLAYSKVLYSNGFKMDIDLKVLSSLGSEEYISGNSEIKLLSSIILMINKILYPADSDMQLSCKASAGLYRRRLLKEMDNVSLSDLDGSTLHELDYIALD